MLLNRTACDRWLRHPTCWTVHVARAHGYAMFIKVYRRMRDLGEQDDAAQQGRRIKGFYGRVSWHMEY